MMLVVFCLGYIVGVLGDGDPGFREFMTAINGGAAQQKTNSCGDTRILYVGQDTKALESRYRANENTEDSHVVVEKGTTVKEWSSDLQSRDMVAFDAHDPPMALFKILSPAFVWEVKIQHDTSILASHRLRRDEGAVIGSSTRDNMGRRIYELTVAYSECREPTTANIKATIQFTGCPGVSFTWNVRCLRKMTNTETLYGLSVASSDNLLHAPDIVSTGQVMPLWTLSNNADLGVKIYDHDHISTFWIWCNNCPGGGVKMGHPRIASDIEVMRPYIVLSDFPRAVSSDWCLIAPRDCHGRCLIDCRGATVERR
eukprot:GHVN01020516.1.p1 GENE.GHVN01020516.1~~GHVN01020516.1.p1  ORF type:complete len:313 (+),score=20.30 GHVN01020516.1:184-1122(+)